MGFPAYLDVDGDDNSVAFPVLIGPKNAQLLGTLFAGKGPDCGIIELLICPAYTADGDLISDPLAAVSYGTIATLDLYDTAETFPLGPLGSADVPFGFTLIPTGVAGDVDGTYDTVTGEWTAGPGLHYLIVHVTGKNASSSGYRAPIMSLALTNLSATRRTEPTTYNAPPAAPSWVDVDAEGVSIAFESDTHDQPTWTRLDDPGA